MPSLAPSDLDASRLLFSLKLCAEAVSMFTGCLDPSVIAKQVTNSLVQKFDCVFARVWLVEPDRTCLRLVASSGLYTRLDGSFASVPMGSFKVGKIAQHCIPFLSNCLSQESWVKDTEWAITNNIQGFAGLPLMAEGQSIGVLAVFSMAPMDPEFLEVLQILSLLVFGALASALNHQTTLAAEVNSDCTAKHHGSALSEQLATILGHRKLSLLGTEQPLETTIHQLLIRLVTYLTELSCQYCRLVYDTDTVVVEAMLAIDQTPNDLSSNSKIQDIVFAASQLGGDLTIQNDNQQTVTALKLQLPKRKAPTPENFSTKATSVADFSSCSASPLSQREREVLQLLVEGLRDRDIAQKLYISERTVKFHIKNTITKLDVKTRIQAAFRATKAGWIG